MNLTLNKVKNEGGKSAEKPYKSRVLEVLGGAQTGISG